eukprot:3672910-Prymnesium_polylepis.1
MNPPGRNGGGGGGGSIGGMGDGALPTVRSRATDIPPQYTVHVLVIRPADIRWVVNQHPMRRDTRPIAVWVVVQPPAIAVRIVRRAVCRRTLQG